MESKSNTKEGAPVAEGLPAEETNGIRDSVADSGGVRGVQMHPPLAASNVLLRT